MGRASSPSPGCVAVGLQVDALICWIIVQVQCTLAGRCNFVEVLVFVLAQLKFCVKAAVDRLYALVLIYELPTHL